MSKLNEETAHEQLLRNVMKKPLNDRDGLMWMVLLHTHKVILADGVLIDPPVPELATITHRHAASLIASLWPTRTGEQASYEYWYREYQLRTPFESIDEVPQEYAGHLESLQQKLMEGPRVRDVIPEV